MAEQAATVGRAGNDAQCFCDKKRRQTINTHKNSDTCLGNAKSVCVLHRSLLSVVREARHTQPPSVFPNNCVDGNHQIGNKGQINGKSVVGGKRYWDQEGESVIVGNSAY